MAITSEMSAKSKAKVMRQMPKKMFKTSESKSKEERIKALGRVIASFFGMGSPMVKKVNGSSRDYATTNLHFNKHIIGYGLTKADVPAAMLHAKEIIAERTSKFDSGETFSKITVK